uniref:Uncharacterized protein n=1 Tax=Oryza nivara TaxID=4536 RepID=A0A0E0IV11_ORYNI
MERREPTRSDTTGPWRAIRRRRRGSRSAGECHSQSRLPRTGTASGPGGTRQPPPRPPPFPSLRSERRTKNGKRKATRSRSHDCCS